MLLLSYMPIMNKLATGADNEFSLSSVYREDTHADVTTTPKIQSVQFAAVERPRYAMAAFASPRIAVVRHTDILYIVTAGAAFPAGRVGGSENSDV